MNANREIINWIVSAEWDMFTAVNEGKARASCQEDRRTFDIMRTAQFEAWSAETVACYKSDLESAQATGRNLVEEKYINMMKTTDPDGYLALHSRATVPAGNVPALARELGALLMEQARVLFEDYPYVSGRGRPLYSVFDDYSVSVETYQLSELLTYSESTLAALLVHVLSLAENGISYAKTVLENTVHFYGFGSLDEAEATTKKHSERGDK